MSASRSDPAPFARDARGAAAIEFAFVVPLLLMVMFAVFQFGWAQHRLSSVRQASEEAIRALAIDPSLTQAAIHTLITGSLEATGEGDVAVTLVKEPVSGGEIARVTAIYVAEFGIPGLAAFKIPYEVQRTAFLGKMS